MNAHDPTDDAIPASAPERKAGTPLGRPLKTALLMAALVAGFYLLREHWNHLAGNWVYLLLLACPLMHLFHGHGGHGRHGAHGSRRSGGDADKE